jgi:hypothetical protein
MGAVSGRILVRHIWFPPDVNASVDFPEKLGRSRQSELLRLSLLSESQTMLNIKTLIAAAVLSGVAVASFAQAPVAVAKPTPATTTAAAPAAMPTDAGATAKPAAKKVKHAHAKKAAAKTAAKPATEAATK